MPVADEEFVPVPCRLSTLVRRAAMAALAALLLAVPAIIASGPALARGAPDGFADLAEKLLPAVVNISTTQTSSRTRRASSPAGHAAIPAGLAVRGVLQGLLRPATSRKATARRRSRARATSLGSGFIIDPAGLVVTNNHVIADADEITVTLHDDTDLQGRGGRPRHQDRSRRCCKVKPTSRCRACSWGDSDQARVGDWVLAIGNPFGLGGTRHRRHPLGARARHPFRPLRRFPADRRLDQPRQFRRPDVQHGRRGHRHQHGDLFALGRLDRHRLRHPVRRWRRPVIEQLKATGKVAARLARRAHPGGDRRDRREPRPRQARAARSSPASTTTARRRPAASSPATSILSFDGKAVDDMRHLPRLVAETPVDKTVQGDGVAQAARSMTLDVKVGELDETEQVARQQDDAQARRRRSRTPAAVKRARADAGQRHAGAEARNSRSPTMPKGVVVVDVAQGQPGRREGRAAPATSSSKRRRRRSRAPARSSPRSTTPRRPAANRSCCWSSAKAICASSRCASTRARASS